MAPAESTPQRTQTRSTRRSPRACRSPSLLSFCSVNSPRSSCRRKPRPSALRPMQKDRAAAEMQGKCALAGLAAAGAPTRLGFLVRCAVRGPALVVVHVPLQAVLGVLSPLLAVLILPCRFGRLVPAASSDLPLYGALQAHSTHIAQVCSANTSAMHCLGCVRLLCAPVAVIEASCSFAVVLPGAQAEPAELVPAGRLRHARMQAPRRQAAPDSCGYHADRGAAPGVDGGGADTNGGGRQLG